MIKTAEHYKKQFALFVKSTDQKRKQARTIIQMIRTLRRKESFLDIGAGSGEITAALSKLFKHTTVIEPNAEQIKRLYTRFPHFRIFQDTLETADLGKEKFDLILCSHVLYYIPEKKWPVMAEKMYKWLKPGGRLLIVLQSPEGGVPNFFRRFAGKEVNSVGLWAHLTRRFGETHVRAHYGIAQIKTRTLEDMTSIGLFLLLNRKFEAKKNEISRYFEKHHRIRGGYRVNQEYLTFQVAKD